jgi:AraC-like DNA-binding protein
MENAYILPLDIVEQIEALSGLKLCLKLFRHDVWQGTAMDGVPVTYQQHQTPFCLAVKQTRMEKCIDCDLRRVPNRVMQQQEPLVHRCHAGASEVIVPLTVSQRLCAVAYLGQFRVSDEQPLTLPLFSPPQIHRALVAATLLQRYFLGEVEGKHLAIARRQGRREQIEAFCKANLHRDFSLSELAAELCISVSRAGHLVREETGESFSSLKLKMRLQEARELLGGTAMTIRSVAESVGINDLRYFHRAFLIETGKTPGSWRKEQASRLHRP